MDLLAFHKARHKIDRVHQVWQEGSHPEQIQGEAMMRQKLEYIHNNPVARGYVDDPAHWRYSSARNYAGQAGLIEIDDAMVSRGVTLERLDLLPRWSVGAREGATRGLPLRPVWAAALVSGLAGQFRVLARRSLVSLAHSFPRSAWECRLGRSSGPYART